jgi:hypothetical protein
MIANKVRIPAKFHMALTSAVSKPRLPCNAPQSDHKNTIFTDRFSEKPLKNTHITTTKKSVHRRRRRRRNSEISC